MKSDALRDLVVFVQFKKREKRPWRSVNFNKDAGFSKLTLLHGYFLRFFKLYKWYQIAQRTISRPQPSLPKKCIHKFLSKNKFAYGEIMHCAVFMENYVIKNIKAAIMFKIASIHYY